MSRLIVKNIPTHISEGNLKKHFESVGPVTDVKIAFKGTRNRKFCFVGYKTDEAAKQAVEHFNNTFIGLNKVSVQPARTLDDPELPRAWSRYTQGSSAFDSKHGTSTNTHQQTPVAATQTKTPQQIAKDSLESNPKYLEFMDLMKQRSAGTMAWTDNLDPADDNPKNRQKELKRIAKEKQMLEMQEKLQADEAQGEEVKDTLGTAKKRIDDIFKRSKEPKPLVAPIGTMDGRRLYVTNIAYNATQEEVQAIFERYGTVSSLKLPRGRGGTLTGYCFVTFALPEEAARAYAELDNKIVMGRIMHAKPALEDDKPEEVVQAPSNPITQETSSYKRVKKGEMLQRLEDPTSWNTVFLNPNSILEAVSRKYGVKKREILSSEGEDVAVRVAMAETQVIKETKEWLTSIGVKLGFLQEDKSKCERSNITIIVKNIQYKVSEDMLNEAFSRYGKVDNLYLSPNRSIAIVQFRDEDHAQNAFKNLSYYKFHGCFFYLEWAPKIMLSEQKAIISKSTQPQIEEEEQQVNDPQNLAKIVYVKNLNFITSDENLRKFFKEYNVQSVKIINRDGLSMGYGFVEFATSADAQKALIRKQNQILDDHNLQLSQSKPKSTQQNVDRKKTVEQVTPSTKLVIRNLPFEANLQELRALVKNYGELKKIRLPKKLNGQHRGFCFSEFVSLEEARNAFEALQSTHFYGRKLVIEYAKEMEM